MIITPIAQTQIDFAAVARAIPGYTTAPGFVHDEDVDTLAEIAGRQCYRSWGRPNPRTATVEGYLANIIEQQHFSVLEHGSVTFHVKGVSRTLLTELERHRHLSFSVVSQRYVNEAQGDAVVPPDGQEDQGFIADLDHHHHRATELYSHWANKLMADGKSVKDARSAARAFLLNSHETEFLVTGNLRTWREVIQKRTSASADKEIQQFAREILYHLDAIAPASVQDLS